MRGSVVAGVLSAGLVAGSALAQDAVQWRVEDGGNGHWYKWTDWGAFATVASAQKEAAQRGAYLATLTSAAEELFVQGSARPGSCEDQPHSEALIGIFQPDGSVEPLGGWRWVTGEEISYSNWRSGEPSDSGGIEDFGFLNLTGGWNDGGASLGCSHAAIFEWSADCNSDGIVDYGQIRAGELDDANANNIPDCCEQGVSCDCPADIDGSGGVNAIDLAIVIGYWGTDGGKDYPQADIDGSGEIDGADLATLLGSWGACE